MIANWKSSNVSTTRVQLFIGSASKDWIFFWFYVKSLDFSLVPRFLLVLRQESGVLLVSRQRLDYLLVSRQEKRFSSCFASGYWIFLWTCVKSLDFLLVSCQEKEFSSCFCIRKLNFPIFFPFLNNSYSIKQIQDKCVNNGSYVSLFIQKKDM